jgi:hypothetical protein
MGSTAMTDLFLHCIQQEMKGGTGKQWKKQGKKSDERRVLEAVDITWMPVSLLDAHSFVAELGSSE